jgi:hypothetical protein
MAARGAEDRGPAYAWLRRGKQRAESFRRRFLVPDRYLNPKEEIKIKIRIKIRRGYPKE